MAEALQMPPLSLLAGAALFLDFDGTLVELAETPGGIAVPSGLLPLLERLDRRLEGRIAILSGRAITDLACYVTDPSIALAGSHGLELRIGGAVRGVLSCPAGLAEAREEIMRFAADKPGLLIEEKPVGIAVHSRRASQHEAGVAELLALLAARTGLIVQHGKMVAELRPAGANKGDALRALMAEPVFAGARPVFVGDDLTDEDGFVAVAAMAGAGILVGPERATTAGWRLDDVAAVARWLEEAAGCV